MNPIILLHGALGAETQLEITRQAIANTNRTVYTMDFSGHHGQPFSPDGFGIEVFAMDILQFMNANKIEKADFFGYSMGGYVALWFAYLHPERIHEIITLGTKFDWSVASAEKEVEKLDPVKITEKIPAFARILEHRHHPNDWREVIAKTSQMMLTLGKNPLLTDDILKQINTPTLILLGDKDDMADPSRSEEVASLLPNGRFRLLPNTPHPLEKVTYIPFLDT